MARWFLFSILTVVLWGVWGFLPRLLDKMSPEQMQVISTLGLFPVMALLAWPRERLSGTNVKRGCVLAIAAGLVGSAGMLGFYRLLNAGQSAATVVPFTSLYPLVTVLLAVLLLKEKLNGIQTAGVVLALVSIYFFNAAREEPFSLGWMAVALLPVVLWGVSGLLQKLCTNDISAELSTLCFLAAQIPLAVLLLFRVPMTWQRTPAEWVWAVTLGLFLGLGNLTLLAAFAAGGKAAIVSPLAGLYSLITVPLAIGGLREKVGGRAWLAIALALAAVIALSYERPPTKNTD
jgi:drug/metabolite transporter (DMT)-like permease